MVPRPSRPALVVLLSLAVSLPLQAQAPSSHTTAEALERWIELPVSPGETADAGAAIRRADPRWTADPQGNLILRQGGGRPRRLVACALDHLGLVVSAVTPDGYLRLHLAGGEPDHPLWTQLREGQQIVAATGDADVPGVVAIPNAHFARQHRADSTVVGVEQLWVDVGARSAEEARALGIALLDPVRRDLPAWPYADFVSGDDAAGRAACAAVAAAARGRPAHGETIFAMTGHASYDWSGLTAVLAEAGDVDSATFVVSAEPGDRDDAPVLVEKDPRPRNFTAAPRVDSIVIVSARARWPGTLVESVRTVDADALLAAVARLADVPVADARWIAPPPVARARPESNDSLSTLAALLASLAVLPGTPAHEARVRDAIRAALPAWARERAATDDAGNLMVAAGPSGDTTLIVAHMDEVAFAVERILPDGRVRLRPQGGVIPSAWEGQPALLHFDTERAASAEPLRGVFVPRDSARVRTPREPLTAWFGMDSAALAARGVRAGLGVTAYKRAERLGATRFTARALDDRAGSTALLLALRALDPARLDHCVLFAWSTSEETGLGGARALAARLGSTIRRVYAVDTFVSSDTPLERPTFAFAPLGAGPVLRALDDGMAVPRAERLRIARIAAAAGIPLQVGATQGSTDDTPFLALGAVGAGLSWPGRYSHSPAEVLDLRDLAALARLVGAVALAPAR